MNRLKFLIAVLFTVALGTGIVVGMGVSRTSPKTQDRGFWLAEELNLTPAQSEKMKTIWSDISRPGQNNFERRRQLQKERDDAVQALLNDEQKTAYLAVVEKFNAQVAELNHEREAAFQAAVESTKDILTDAQKTKYDELMKRGFRGGGRPDGGPGRMEGGPHMDGRGEHDGGAHWGGSSATRRGEPFAPSATAPAPASATQKAPQ
jgi:uncharacterized protein YdbL (DUF1318 family)